MAPIAPEAVFAAIDANSYESNNHYVHQTLLEIAAELPADLAALIALAESKWSSQEQRFYHLYDEKIVPLILNLAASGRSDAALAILNPVLQVEAAPERTREPVTLIDGRPLHGSGTPVGRIDSWNIQRLLLQVSKPLVGAAPESFLALIAEKLNVAVDIHVNERGNGDDFSLIWRPRIESGRFGDLTDTLISGTRDAAVQVVQGGGHEMVLRILGKYSWPIFRRLEYYALSCADNLPPNFVNGLALHEKLYEDQRANPEFNDFLSKFAGTLSDEVRNKLLAMVDSGPDLSKYSSFLNGKAISARRLSAG